MNNRLRYLLAFILILALEVGIALYAVSYTHLDVYKRQAAPAL